MAPQVADDLCGLRAPVDLDADEDVRFPRIGDAVVELGDVAAAKRRAERLEATRALGDGDREYCLPVLAKLGFLGDEAQAVEVRIGARGHGDQRLAARAMALHPGFRAGDAERARRL